MKRANSRLSVPLGAWAHVVDAEGQLARLAYEVLRQEAGRSLIRIHLDTGRYHQIRIQLAHAGCPIMGDVKYGSKSSFSKDAIALHHLSFSLLTPFRMKLSALRLRYLIGQNNNCFL